MKKLIFLGLVVLLFFSVNASAIASCARDSFLDSCSYCKIYTNGDMDEACYNRYKDDGLECVAKSYVLMTLAHETVGCPALDACVAELEACVNIRCPGNALQDCENGLCLTCYYAADRCTYRASADCSMESRCGDRKCEEDKGETRETCCQDCGCPPDLVCRYDGCMSSDLISDLEAGNPVTTTLLPPRAEEAETVFDWINELCGYPIFLVIPLMMFTTVVDFSKK